MPCGPAVRPSPGGTLTQSCAQRAGHRLPCSTFFTGWKKKGWVKSGKDGNRNTYTPAITQRAYNVWSMRERLDTLFGGDLAAAVHALVSESGCGQSELEQAMKVLEEKHLEAEEYDLYDPYG